MFAMLDKSPKNGMSPNGFPELPLSSLITFSVGSTFSY
jgi:hypothetical protein